MLPASAIPAALTWSRAALGPVVILLANLWPRPAAFGVCLAVAFLSDFFDGIVARRLGVATAELRRSDSIADSIFYFSALWAVWMLHPETLVRNAPLVGLLVVLECARYLYDFWKFGREASYHMWSSKLWGIGLFLGFASILVFGHDGALVTGAILLGILADLEGLSISVVLKSWRHDVPTIVHALKLKG